MNSFKDSSIMAKFFANSFIKIVRIIVLDIGNRRDNIGDQPAQIFHTIKKGEFLPALIKYKFIIVFMLLAAYTAKFTSETALVTLCQVSS